MSELHDMMCCGILEYHGLNDRYKTEKDVIDDILNDAVSECDADRLRRGQGPCAHLVFTEIVGVNDDVGLKVMKLVKEANLGDMRAMPARRNPNSGNDVRPFIWSPKWRNLYDWARENIDGFDERYKNRVEGIRELRREWAW